MNNKFRDDFLWGAATASAQIEGGWNEDGRTPSIWDLAPNGKIKGGADCHTACDHFHRVKEDIALMKELGLKSYRFSISWSRIQPRENEINQKGLDFYINLVDELRKACDHLSLGFADLGASKGRIFKRRNHTAF